MIRFALSSVKTVVWIILAPIFFVCAFWIYVNIMVWQNCSASLEGSLTWETEEAFERGSLIAFYKTNAHLETRRIVVERMQWRRPWKYIFYTPRYYSKGFCVNPLTAPANTEFIIAAEDTVVMYGTSVFNQLPPELKVYLWKKNDPIIYTLDQKFQENIDNITTVPFFEKWDSGPLLNDD